MDSPQMDVLSARTDRSRRVELIAAGLTLLAGIGIVVGTVAWRQSSANASPAKVAGRSVLPDALTKSLGEVAPEATATVAFTLRNLTSHPIQIQGAQTSCSCTVVEGIPCSIEAGGTRDVKGVVQAGKKLGPFDGSFVLYTDDDGEPEVRLGYTGRVIDAPL